MLILKQNAANTVPTPPAGKGTIFLDDSDVLSVKTSSGDVENFPTVAASNSQVVFMNGSALSGEAALTYDFNNNVLTVNGNVAAGNVKTDNLLYANGTPWDLSDPGGSNTEIQFNDDESFGGSAAFTFNKTSNLVSMGGALSVTGNANVNNLGTAQVLASANVTAPQFISNISTGSAPLVVTSTTRVANLDVEKAGVANTVNDAAQPNITSVGTLTGLTVSSTITGSVSGTAATVTTAAQPNITSVGTLTTLSVSGNAIVGNIGAAAGVFTDVSGNGSALTALNASNVSSGTLAQARLANASSTLGNTTLTLGGTVTVVTGLSSITATTFFGDLSGAATTATTVTSAAQPNITSVGTLGGLAVNGAVLVDGTITAVSVVANTGTFTGNGSGLSALNASNVSSGTLAQARLANASLTLGSTSLTLGDTVTTVAGLSSVTSTTFVGALTGAATTAGTVTTAAQPNITSVGTLTSLDVSGNANVGNLGTAGLITATGNVSGGNLTTAGVVAATGNVSGGNLTTAGALSVTGNANVGNIGAAAGVFTGNLSVSGNAVINGNLNVEGNLVYINVSDLSVEDSIIQLQTGPNAAPPSSNTGLDVGTALNYYDTQARIAFMGWDTSAAEFGMASVATIANEVVTFSTYGNLRVGNIIGNGQALTGLAGGNVSGQVANALVAGTVYTAAQPNITSVGTLSALTVSSTISGSVSGSAATVTTAAQPNITSVGTLTSLAVTGNISAGNVSATTFTGALSGAATSATTAGTVTTAAQPNITSTGTLTGLGVNGNITAANITANTGVFTGNGSGISAMNGSNITTGTVAAARVATLNQNTTGSAATVTTAAQPNITSVGTLTGLTVSSTISGSVSGSAGTAGTVTTAAQPNITSVGTLTSLTVSGSTSVTGNSALTATNITTGANTTLGYLTGNWTLTTGSRLQATYADLAEYYAADKNYPAGTVLEFGGDKEVTLAGIESNKIAGVVSAEPAYVMNGNIQTENPVIIALIGRIKVKATGYINKGDMLVSAGNGFAKTSIMTPKLGTVIGKAIENKTDNGEGFVEVMVGRL